MVVLCGAGGAAGQRGSRVACSPGRRGGPGYLPGKLAVKSFWGVGIATVQILAFAPSTEMIRSSVTVTLSDSTSTGGPWTLPGSLTSNLIARDRAGQLQPAGSRCS